MRGGIPPPRFYRRARSRRPWPDAECPCVVRRCPTWRIHVNSHLATLAALALLLLAPLAIASSPVNINTADAPTLAQSLDGVGLAKAQAIIAWREANGAF